MKTVKIGLGIAVLGGIWLFVFFSTKDFLSKEPPITKPVASSGLRQGSPALPRRTVVKVNSVPITAGELEEEFERLLPPTTAHGGADPQKKSNVQKMALEELIVRELAYQKATAMQLKVAPAERESTIQKIKGRYKTDQSFQEALRAEQITEEEFIHRVEKDLLLRQIYKLEIEDQAKISDSEAKDFYDKNKAKFMVPESIQLRHIVVKAKPENGTSSEKKIQEAFDKLQAGEPFEDVAYRYSEDDYRVMGGDYGSVHRGRLALELENAAFAAKLKTLTGPFRTSMGWHILRVDDHQPERQMKFPEAREQIVAALHRKRLNEKRTAFILDLKVGARIDYLKSP